MAPKLKFSEKDKEAARELKSHLESANKLIGELFDLGYSVNIEVYHEGGKQLTELKQLNGLITLKVSHEVNLLGG